MSYRKKLIEVALPLEAINTECIKEKNPFLKNHPRAIHLWWARRPLAAARAVIFTSLIDDPDQDGVPQKLLDLIDKLPLVNKLTDATIGETRREKLFEFIEKLVKWENIKNPKIISTAQELIKAATDDNPPPLHDPFAGGGSIPIEAQRLGLETYASDLNPVAVIINKLLIEIPPKFAEQPPINPESRKNPLKKKWECAQGLAEDVRYYGEWMKQQAFEKIGHLYPKIKDKNGKEYTVIAWIWARTVKCPNPACGCEMPLVISFELSKKKGKEAYVQPIINGKNISYEVRYGNDVPESPKLSRGSKFKCICCGELTTPEYIKDRAMNNHIGTTLIATVAEGTGGKLYLTPTEDQIVAAQIQKPSDCPTQELPFDPRAIWCPLYGLDTYDKLFTNRQLKALSTFHKLVDDVQSEIIKVGGTKEYAQAICVYLSCGISQLSRYSCTLCGWNKTNENIVQAFGRQALPMVWDFAEANPFEGSLSITSTIEWPVSAISAIGKTGRVEQADAQSQTLSNNKVVSTDPPYYDNIGYADLSDFFYVWLRRSLKNIYPQLFSTISVPKEEELIAMPYRHGGKEQAENFFLNGMTKAMRNIAEQSHPDFPITIYYAYKQSDNENELGVSSTGWDTFLTAVLNSGLTLTGTWPMRTERPTGLKVSVNALASSIVLVCRKRPADATICTRRDFVNTLKRELKPALQKLQASNIAPVDLQQSAIGPGMGVYSRFSQVLEADGKPMSVRSALQIINQELDLYFTEQDGELDRDSRFCIDLYTQYAFNEMKFGEADVLARAKNTSVEKLDSRGVVYAQKGIVRLLTREEITDKLHIDNIWLLTQQLTKAMENDGVVGAAKIVAEILTSQPEQAKALAYRLFTLAERKGWAQEAYAYNSLVVAWPEVQAKAAELKSKNYQAEQMTIFE